MIGLNTLNKQVVRLESELDKLAKRKLISPEELSDALQEFKDKLSSIEETLGALKNVKKEAKDDFEKKIEEMRVHLMRFISQHASSLSTATPGGGNANRNIQVDSVNVLQPFTDINLISGTGITITSVPNQTTKYTDITITASGSASIAIGDTITGATEGSVLFAGPSGVLAQDNANFFWDDTANTLVVGSNTAISGVRVQSQTGSNVFNFLGS